MPKPEGATPQVLSHLEESVPLQAWEGLLMGRGFLTALGSCLLNL